MVIDEFDRNGARVKASMAASIASRFKQIRQDVLTYGSDDDAYAAKAIKDLCRHLPLIDAMTTRNFEQFVSFLSLAR
ncbi:hypothetical protein ITJ55_07160 [Frigoribacterium sp. VKM Ac-1396]|uniref:hypothetical protein n=1 Tax=Frigoribacterium sp. VKM Ac-1396 TaxID=2783821 RepID=UPI001889DB2D|nr:hypothetical protein [Frigoribacterium sp. VKM Ac-1396]MBF4600584.1 hypothetical protein [Frigoribacterium sp. VKM Ac-1396]